jgi:hypothetical protein
MLAEDIVTDQDWCRYVLKYMNEAVTFHNAGHTIFPRLVPNLYEINTDPPQSPQLVPKASVNLQ